MESQAITTKKKKSRCLLMVSVMAGVIILGVMLFPQERLLLDRATKVADVRGWDCPGVMSEQPAWQEREVIGSEFRWVSESKIFFERDGKVLLYDISTHTEIPLTILNRRMKSENSGGTNLMELSPDGKWLLWTDLVGSDTAPLTAVGAYGAPRGKNMRAARLDGTGFQIVSVPAPATVIGPFTWTYDSRHWIAGGYRPLESDVLENMFQGDISAPGRVTLLPLFTLSDLYNVREIQTADSPHAPWLPYEVPGAPHRGTVLTSKPPKDMQIVEVEQSHGGGKLAWVFLYNRPAPFAQWIGKIWPRYATSHTLASVWLSNRDGSGLHELGHLLVVKDDDLREFPDSLRWLPSDKKVSFHFKGAIWTIPVE